MSASILIPLQVLGIGIVISYCMAFLMKIMLDVIQKFTKKSENE